MMQITRTSPVTGNTSTMTLDVTEQQLAAWQHGTLLQDAFPNIGASEREFIKTGITPEEWDELFGVEE